MAAAQEGSRVPAATRAVRLLRFLASQGGPVSAGTLACALDLPRSSVYQLLEALAAEGFVVHLSEEQRWGLGVAAFEVGSAYLRHDPLERLARPALARLADELRVTAHLGVLHGADTLYLVKEQPRNLPSLVTGVGVRLPAHLTASGRAMLARLPRAQVRALYPSRESFVRRTDHGPASAQELRTLLDEERRRGWSSEHGQVTPGYVSVAAPVFDHATHPVAAVSITVPDWRSDQCAHLAGRARHVAARLTERVSGRHRRTGQP
ncbi:IclR family transcriptional regulator [Lipingzhangella sp. LS1_29]|uniref:IclR family transcriptional regulator n=1 Tax=Lipingzhangella rawalii TaxID=2055835 RepID=A0ABU2H0A8_9ACTN|nr:IclR family transcriptional regulator [Lipingzhangella rawalii]MDS1268736.1 IclR family transcriptional regulator [Lipingzhangella rawalii]